MSENILEIKNLSVEFCTFDGVVKAINGMSFDVPRGKTVGLVGETGAGKTTTALSVMGLVQSPPGVITEGEILFDGEDLLKAGEAKLRKYRGDKISMIFQNPMTSLNPVYTVGRQIANVIMQHQNVNKAEAEKRAGDMLEVVGIPRERTANYPHEFSGGMRQRVCIAMGLACNPSLLIADEPTTALDVTIQAQVLSLMKELNERLGTATILITHNLGCASSICDKIIVMYGGKVMEEGTTEEIFYEPRHPYTMGLLNSIPKVTGEESKQRLIPILGTPPDMLNPPTGCPFYPRCQFAMKACASMQVPEQYLSETHRVSCFMCHPQAPSNPMYEAQKGGIRRDQ